MKKNSFALLLPLFCISIGIAQNSISTNDIIQASKCKELNCFRQFASSHDYSYYESKTGDGWRAINFASDREYLASSNRNVRTRNTLVCVSDGVGASVSVGTANKNYFGKLYEEVKNLRVKKVDTLIEGNKIIEVFRSEIFPDLNIRVTTERTSNVRESWTTYSVSIAS